MGAARVGAFLLIELRLDGHPIGSPKQRPRPRPRPRTVVALEYYKAHPEHVSALVFGGPVFNWRAYAREAEAWTKQMSDSGQRAIAQWKKDGIDTTRSFKAATDEFYAKFVWQRPIQADLDSTNATFGAPQYLYMQGAYEYVVPGTMKNYDQTSFLPQIKVPVLSVTGEFDEVGPRTIEKHARLIPGAKFVLCKNAAHITTWDATDANVKDVREFARVVDKRRTYAARVAGLHGADRRLFVKSARASACGFTRMRLFGA